MWKILDILAWFFPDNTRHPTHISIFFIICTKDRLWGYFPIFCTCSVCYYYHSTDKGNENHWWLYSLDKWVPMCRSPHHSSCDLLADLFDWYNTIKKLSLLHKPHIVVLIEKMALFSVNNTGITYSAPPAFRLAALLTSVTSESHIHGHPSR